MTLKKCSLCQKNRELQVSHAIGDSIFRKIFQQDSGKGIEISLGDKPLSYTNDSWAVRQLCKSCESFLNKKYEQYSLAILRGNGCTINKTDSGISFNGIDQHKLTQYFLSIMWRTSKSDHPAYDNVKIPGTELDDYLRMALLQNNFIPHQLFTIKLSKLTDRRDSGFNLKALKSIVSAPFFRKMPSKKHMRTNVAYCLIFEGFLIEIFLGGLRAADRRQPGVLAKTKAILFVPNVDLFEIKEFIDSLYAGVDKFKKGNFKLNEKFNKKFEEINTYSTNFLQTETKSDGSF